MKLKNLLLFLFVLPLTLFLDFILYAMLKSCPSCGSFGEWLKTEGAISFPVVISLSEWVEQFISRLNNRR
jgi:hypothetical protein